MPRRAGVAAPRVTPDSTYDDLMRLAVAQASKAEVVGDVPVGAVLVDGTGALLGSGYNERESAHDPTAHAEVLAIRAAAHARQSWRLDDCTLVVTLEPCTMCAGAAVLARLRRIVYGASDPKAGAVGSVWGGVRDRRVHPPPGVVRGVRAGGSEPRVSHRC